MRQVNRQRFYLMNIYFMNEIVWGKRLHYYSHLGKVTI